MTECDDRICVPEKNEHEFTNNIAMTGWANL